VAKMRAARREWLARAQAAEPICAAAQQLDLREQAQVADLVEEERAVLGLLEVAFAGATVPVNAPFS